MHFDMAEQCENLDRSWFGETRFPVAKYVYQVQSSVNYDSTPDPADLDLEHGYRPQSCVFPSHKSEIQRVHYSIVELLMRYFQDICFRKELDPLKSLSF